MKAAVNWSRWLDKIFKRVTIFIWIYRFPSFEVVIFIFPIFWIEFSIRCEGVFIPHATKIDPSDVFNLVSIYQILNSIIFQIGFHKINCVVNAYYVFNMIRLSVIVLNKSFITVLSNNFVKLSSVGPGFNIFSQKLIVHWNY